MNGLNLYCYCTNYSINHYDSEGHFWNWIFDAFFLIWSIVGAIKNPDNWRNWASLGVDLIFAVIPFVYNIMQNK